jgi:hypothetical protein
VRFGDGELFSGGEHAKVLHRRMRQLKVDCEGALRLIDDGCH